MSFRAIVLSLQTVPRLVVKSSRLIRQLREAPLHRRSTLLRSFLRNPRPFNCSFFHFRQRLSPEQLTCSYLCRILAIVVSGRHRSSHLSKQLHVTRLPFSGLELSPDRERVTKKII